MIQSKTNKNNTKKQLLELVESSRRNPELETYTPQRKMSKRFKMAFNAYLYLYEYYRKKIKLMNMPRIWTIELTNFCNLSCLMCPRRFMKREVGFMEFNLFQNIIKQCRDYTDFLWLHLFGESLFHPKLAQFINHCSKNHISTGLSTNATILTSDKAHIILNSKLDVLICCLDGNTEEIYQKTRIGGNFDQTRENIIRFLELKKKFNKKLPHTVVQIIRMNHTENELDEFKKQWQDLADEVYIKNFTSWAGQVKEIVTKCMNHEETGLSGKRKREPCHFFWRDMVVLWNGDVVPCCMDFDGKLVFGNLYQETLKDIWNSPKIKLFRKDQIEQNYDNPLCKNCT